MIQVAEAEDVVRAARTDLGLEPSPTIDREYIAAALRRLAGFLCPCSPKTLLGSMVESHRGVASEDFADQVEATIDALVAVGDLLELSDVATLDETVKSTWLFAAPPSFVLRASGTAFLLGLAPDEATPLPVELRRRLRTRGATRTIDPSPGENLQSLLTGLGLRHLSMENWLRHPKQEAHGRSSPRWTTCSTDKPVLATWRTSAFWMEGGPHDSTGRVGARPAR